MSQSKEHFRHCLLYEFQQGKKAKDAFNSLCTVFGEEVVTYPTVTRWFKRFTNGDFNLDDREREGRPEKVLDGDLKALLDENPCRTQQELAEVLEVDQTTISSHLKAMGKIAKAGKWVPHKLSEANKNERIDTCHSLLVKHHKKSFLHKIITGDEKWIYFDNPKREKSYVDLGQPSTSTPKREIHGDKVMLCVWWDWKGILYYELLQQRQTVTAERYCEQLNRLNEILDEKRPFVGQGTRPVKLLHDNARPHVAKSVRDTLTSLRWEALRHVAYSPDLAPSDYHLFRSMNNALQGVRFQTLEEVKKWVDNFFKSKSQQFFRDGINDLPRRLQKVLDNNGDYFDD